jgi:N-acetylglucosamine kinase-like BadF-type ATPase
MGGLLGADLRKIYDWVFILGTIGSAVWLAVAMFQHLEALVDALRSDAAGGKS